MSSFEDKEKHSRRRKRNIYAKILRSGGSDLKGAFSPKIKPGKKREPYKRIKIDERIFEEEN